MPTPLQLERHAPWLLGLACALAWWRLGGEIPAAIAKELLAALLSAAAICAGFLTTALTVVLPMGGTVIGRQLKRRGKLHLLHGYVRAAIYGALALVALCVLGFFQVPSGGTGALWASSLIMGVAMYCAAAMVRVVEILIKVMLAMSEEERP
ncbi:hypothetical protein [Comamonas sp. NLF-1-9]|uniref:hypothetical protein n=1 Tax=Comamonas sp. NLF-1-9 TaxID=2853163 RepID=UPI001C48716E|nr:hypothetical protein [Comamonas sp. NLF-1-9]QXL84120.1 hypothetical protein KUD94_12900 [Comamonas sp. NLF-1-9]